MEITKEALTNNVVEALEYIMENGINGVKKQIDFQRKYSYKQSSINKLIRGTADFNAPTDLILLLMREFDVSSDFLFFTEKPIIKTRKDRLRDQEGEEAFAEMKNENSVLKKQLSVLHDYIDKLKQETK